MIENSFYCLKRIQYDQEIFDDFDNQYGPGFDKLYRQ